jgi:hypothetical protein
MAPLQLQDQHNTSKHSVEKAHSRSPAEAPVPRPYVGLVGWRYAVVVKVHVTVGFGPQADAPTHRLGHDVLQI